MPSRINLYFGNNANPGITASTFNNGLQTVQIPGTVGDLQVLHYALALELLETELYKEALARATTGGQDQIGNSFGGLNLGNTPLVQYLTEFGQVEASHASFLLGALGYSATNPDPYTKAGVKFSFGLGGVNSALGLAQLIYGAELTGVSAYLGAVPLFSSGTYVQTAASIVGTEARHTAALAIAQNTLGASPPVETAPLIGAGQNGGKDLPLLPDFVLNGNGNFSTSAVPGGVISPVSGPAGLIYI